jgi:uncharacterized membrane protein YhiD involved in acid resistance
MFDLWQNNGNFTGTIWSILLNLTVAFLCGLLISILYKQTYRGPGYSQSFINTIILIAMITSVVIMIIGNNLARAFGLVGAMSIIRFRTAIKEPLDIIYVFFSLAVGMAAGVGNYQIALVGTLFIGIIIYIFTVVITLSTKHQKFLLQFEFAPNNQEKPFYHDVLKKYCRKYDIINVKSLEEYEMLELSYYVELKDKQSNNKFIKELQDTEGIETINLYCDEREF